MREMTITKIEKEQLSQLEFLSQDKNLKKQAQIKKKLYIGMLLGNIYRNKVKIYFKSKEGAKMVETTIWATTDKNVILKGGIAIPIPSINKVGFY